MALPRIVVVGAGYAGLSTSLRLAREVGCRTEIDLVDGRADHQLITRLHEVAAERLSADAAAIPLHRLLAGTGVRVHQAVVDGLDPQRGQVLTNEGALDYDALVLAPGSQTDYSGVPGAAEFALPLRTLEDAVRLREALRGSLERARGLTGADRQAALSYVLVGGGYTGVELAAEVAIWLPGLARRRGLPARAVHVRLLEAGPRLLPGHDAWLARRAAERLDGLGVEVTLSSPVVAVDSDGVVLGGRHTHAHTVIWASGVRAPAWLADVGLQVGHGGRARVDAYLRALHHPSVLVIGDAAEAHNRAGAELPASAQLAIQQAALVADNLASDLRGRAPRAFVPRLLGEALSLGPRAGIALVGGLRLEDAPAVLVKRLSHARYLDQLGGPALNLRQLARQQSWLWGADGG